MTVKASDTNKLLCNNNTIKTHHVNRSDFFKKTWLSRQDIQSKTIIFISNKVYEDLKVNKVRQMSPMTKKALDANKLLCDNNTVKTYHVNQSDFFKNTQLSR